MPPTTERSPNDSIELDTIDTVSASSSASCDLHTDMTTRQAILNFLRQAKENPELLHEDRETRAEFYAAFKSMKKSKKRKINEAAKARDAELINQTENVRRKKLKATANSAPVLLLLPAAPQHAVESADVEEPHLLRPRSCYVCKEHYTKLHHFYDRLCPSCASINFAKRQQTADLSGRIALVTGARIKIGYEICLKLLRAGCAKVIATTRFPRDAAQRFASEPDFESFKDRLDIYGLDLIAVPNVEKFCAFISTKYSHLDILINNAAMTLTRPPSFYDHLAALESAPLESLPLSIQSVLERTETSLSTSFSRPVPLLPSSSGTPTLSISHAASMNSVDLKYDGDGQLIDTSSVNSWKQELEDVPTADLAQVMLINAIAPFVLNAKLKPLLERSPFMSRFVINVSAMEGQFARRNKTSRHPHTNCAKASLNMMTRTSSSHYAKSCIYMNSVDTGWVSEMLPVPTAENIHEYTLEFSRIPLDEVDGAARVLDPIFTGLNDGIFVFGKFLKDYKEAEW